MYCYVLLPVTFVSTEQCSFNLPLRSWWWKPGKHTSLQLKEWRASPTRNLDGTPTTPLKQSSNKNINDDITLNLQLMTLDILGHDSGTCSTCALPQDCLATQTSTRAFFDYQNSLKKDIRDTWTQWKQATRQNRKWQDKLAGHLCTICAVRLATATAAGPHLLSVLQLRKGAEINQFCASISFLGSSLFMPLLLAMHFSMSGYILDVARELSWISIDSQDGLKFKGSAFNCFKSEVEFALQRRWYFLSHLPTPAMVVTWCLMECMWSQFTWKTQMVPWKYCAIVPRDHTLSHTHTHIHTFIKRKLLVLFALSKGTAVWGLG